MELRVMALNYLHADGFKLFHSVLCCASYAGMGAVFTLLGSSLLDYQILINENFQKVACLVQQRAIGYILGSLLAGFIEKYVNKVLSLSLTNLVLGLSIIASPWSDNFLALSAATIVGGVALGFLEIFCNVYIAHMWKERSANYLQSLHMLFDIGALIGPLITRPFLLPMDPDDYELLHLKGNNQTDIKTYTKDDLLIQYPHLMLGIFLILVALIFGFTYICHNSITEDQSAAERDAEERGNENNAKWKQTTALIVTALIVNFEFGGQNLISALGPAFGVKSNLKMNKQDAALFVTFYWAIACLYRIILIPLTMYFNEPILIVINVIIAISGAATLLSGADSNLTLTWISFGLLSMGFSPCFAFSFGLIQKYFTVSSRATSLIFFVGTLGESIHPWIVAGYMESYSAFYTNYFAVIVFLNSFLCIFLVVFTLNFFKTTSVNRLGYQEL